MHITLQSRQLQLTVDTLGAQMMSIRSSNGCEYLWQGDPAYWRDRAPVLFPVIARLYEAKHRVRGRDYPMGIHGFAARSEFRVEEQSEAQLTLRLDSSPETISQYPFPFTFRTVYRLMENTVEITYRVQNTGEQDMFFGIGGHPGFRVPLDETDRFEDYRLEFSKPCQPDRVLFTPQVLLSGQTAPYPLQAGQSIGLTHGLFDDDAIILRNTDRTVSLCRGSDRCLAVSFPDMPYIGFWHRPKTDAPYVCIEPWSTLPGRQDIVEDLSCRSDLIRLSAGGQYTNTWSVTVFEK